MNDGLVESSCVGTVQDVLGRLLIQLEQRGVKLFAVIDHGNAAHEVGLELRDEVVAIFGNPAVGTQLMQHSPRAGIDLPLRILIWDDEGTTKSVYTPPTALVERFSLDGHQLPIDKLADLLEELADAIRR